MLRSYAVEAHSPLALRERAGGEGNCITPSISVASLG
jgi:hypothetical protein